MFPQTHRLLPVYVQTVGDRADYNRQGPICVLWYASPWDLAVGPGKQGKGSWSFVTSFDFRFLTAFLMMSWRFCVTEVLRLSPVSHGLNIKVETTSLG